MPCRSPGSESEEEMGSECLEKLEKRAMRQDEISWDTYKHARGSAAALHQ